MATKSRKHGDVGLVGREHLFGHCQVVATDLQLQRDSMLNLSDLSRRKEFRFPHSLIYYAVWSDNRFALSLRYVKDLLAAQGITVSYQTVLY